MSAASVFAGDRFSCVDFLSAAASVQVITLVAQTFGHGSRVCACDRFCGLTSGQHAALSVAAFVLGDRFGGSLLACSWDFGSGEAVCAVALTAAHS